jgi:hypothetical protein
LAFKAKFRESSARHPFRKSKMLSRALPLNQSFQPLKAGQ